MTVEAGGFSEKTTEEIGRNLRGNALRRIIQIAAVAVPETRGSEYFEVVYALCSDGTVWMKEFPGDRIWTKLADIPQD